MHELHISLCVCEAAAAAFSIFEVARASMNGVACVLFLTCSPDTSMCVLYRSPCTALRSALTHFCLLPKSAGGGERSQHDDMRAYAGSVWERASSAASLAGAGARLRLQPLMLAGSARAQVALNAVSMTMCGLMLESILESASDFVSVAEEAHFIQRCREFAHRCP